MLFSDIELWLLEIEETLDAYTVKPKVYLVRKIFKAISDVVRLTGGKYFSAEKTNKFIIPRANSRSALEDLSACGP